MTVGLAALKPQIRGGPAGWGSGNSGCCSSRRRWGEGTPLLLCSQGHKEGAAPLLQVY